jgi:hypothetical protein
MIDMQRYEKVEDDFKKGEISEGKAFTTLVDFYIEEDNFEYDDFGMPDFDDLNKRVNKIINRWKAEINSENKSEELY